MVLGLCRRLFQQLRALSHLLHFMDFPTLPEVASSYNLLQKRRRQKSARYLHGVFSEAKMTTSHIWLENHMSKLSSMKTYVCYLKH
jgi:hypothetical protein